MTHTAEHINGIILKIGGDTSGLSKALKATDKEIHSTQSELKKVERLLKFDPKSTVLLAQKQELLAGNIKKTKEKLESLKQAEKQAQEQFKKGEISQDMYRGLQREIESTKQSLKELKHEHSKLSPIVDALSAKNEKFNSVLNKSTKTAVAVGSAYVAMGTQSAISFDKSFSKVQTIADTTNISVDELKNGIKDLSTETGKSVNELNEALYQAISAGADTTHATELVEVAVKSAKGGFTDTATAVDGLTTVLNTYNMETSDAQKIANQMLVTQNKGKTTFGELATSVGKVAPIFKSVELSSEELFSSLASLTANGLNTSEAVTGIKSAISNIIKPSAEAKKLAQSLGLEFNSTALSSKGLAGFLQDVKEKTDGNTETMAKLFGSVEGLNSVLTLTSDSGMSLMLDTIQEMQTNTTALDDAYNTMSDSLSSQNEKALNQLRNISMELGEKLMPIISRVITLVSTHIDTIIPVAGIIMGIVLALKSTVTVMTAFNAVGTVMSLKIMAIIAIIGLLVSAIIYARNHWDEIVVFLKAIWEYLKAKFFEIVTAIKEAWHLTVQWFIDTWTFLKTKFTEFITNIINLFKNLNNWLDTVFKTDWTKHFGAFGNVLNAFFHNVQNIKNRITAIFTSLLNFIKNVFTGNWRGAWQNIVDIFKNVFGLIKDYAKIPINGIIGLLNGAIDGINWLIDGLNSIQFDIPKWVPALGGKSFGINIPEISNIPFLAKGGILSQGSAIVGEAGPELLSMIGGRAIVEPLTQGSESRKLSKSFSFVQNNYSPKALSKIEIYRNTKNQFSAFERKLEYD